MNQGKVMEFENYLELANGANISARNMVSRLRKQLYYKSSKLALGEFANQIFEQGININQELYSQTGEIDYLNELLNCFEGNRANLLAEAFQVSKVHGFTNLPDSLIRVEVSVYNEIAENESAIIFSKDSIEIATLKDDLFALNGRYEEILKQKNQFQLKDISNGQGTKISDIQNLLGDREILLEYFAGENNYHLLAITSKSAEYHHLGSVNQLDSVIVQFVNLAKDPKTLYLGKYGQDIYKKALFPALSGKRLSTLIVIPDGSLNYLPFEALTTSEKDKANVQDYLINSYTIRSHYSASLFKRLSESSPDSNLKPYVGFAPEFDRESNPLLARRSGGDVALSNSLEKLPGAELEVRTAADYFDGEAVIGAGATESYFKQMAAGFDLIHLASHTLVDIEKPLYSKLVFASEDSDEDGLLHLYELYGMRLNCSLVSLSACNTGIGRSYKGEGMMSLGRGFLGAGARNVLMTLWSVSDQSSGSIMNSFYEKLKNGKYEPEALRQAKLDYLKNSDELTSHPYYWSGYTFIGNGTKQDSNFILWLIGVVVMFTALLISRRFRASS